mmetsp:Transcript_26376/g.42278  ORF Transcript_26376/g.42278 Transcript_26376/m.42278 type:complete len:219 (-) Transcript_26376:254-910(-)
MCGVIFDQRLHAGAGGGKARECVLRQLYQFIVVHGASTNEHHAVSGVVRFDVLRQVVARDAFNVISRSQDGAPQTRVLERSGVQVVEQHLFDLLLHLLHLAQDHAAFALDVCLLQIGILQNILQYVHRFGHICFEHLGVVGSLLTAGVGIKMSAHVLDLLFQSRSCAPGSTLESHVLQKMCSAVVGFSFVTAACVDPHANSGCLRKWCRLCCNAHAIS